MMTVLPLVSAPRLVCNIELDVTAEPVTIYEEGDAPSGGGISGLPGYSDVTVRSARLAELALERSLPKSASRVTRTPMP